MAVFKALSRILAALRHGDIGIRTAMLAILAVLLLKIGVRPPWVE